MIVNTTPEKIDNFADNSRPKPQRNYGRKCDHLRPSSLRFVGCFYFFPAVTCGKSSVRKGEAGRPALLNRL
jgi:hypothetical protein